MADINGIMQMMGGARGGWGVGGTRNAQSGGGFWGGTSGVTSYTPGGTFEDFLRRMGLDPRQIDPGQLAQLYGQWAQANPAVIDVRQLQMDRGPLLGQRTAPLRPGAYPGGR